MQLDQPGNVFRLSFLALLCLSTIILTYSEYYLFPQILGIPIILLTYTYVDKKQVWGINPTVAAFLGLVALSLGFAEFMLGGIEARILSAAHVVSYLLWITLFQKKEPRQYWWMTALTVMQMAVASVLTSEGLFGVGILMYLFLIIWTLAFFSVYRAALRIRSATNQVQAKSNGGSSAAISSGRRFYLISAKSTARGSIHLNPGEPWISWQFFGGVAFITFLSLIVAGMFFTFTPRLWLGRLHFPSDSDESMVKSLSGFTESVRLGEMGNIMENPAVVFNAKLFKSETSMPISVEQFCTEYGMDTVLFRGSVMTKYSDSKWSSPFESQESNQMLLKRQQGKYTCEYEQIQTTGSFLFSLGRFGNITEISDSIGAISCDSTSEVIKSSFPGKLKYSHSIYTSVVNDGHFCNPVSVETLSQYIMTDYLKTCSSYTNIRLSGILYYTNKLIEAEENRLQRSMSKIEIAFFLENYLQNSKEFVYSLNQKINDPSIDPVADFLLNRKSGHCEYFSSALALMLRSQGIPTRLISGFKGGDYLKEKSLIQVKQLHAHAWMEFFDYETRSWITLDPTPAAARETQIAQIQSELITNESMTSKALSFWSSYVVNVSLEQQQKLFYEPLFNSIRSTWDSLSDVRNFIGVSWEIVVEIFSDPKQLFSIRGFVLVSILGMFAVLIWFIFNRLIPSIKQKMQQKNIRYRTDLRVAFYERYQQVLKKLQLIREDQQTPLELSLAAGKKLQERSLPKEHLTLLEEITKAYYHIRFGNYELSEQEHLNWIDKVSKLDEQVMLVQSDK